MAVRRAHEESEAAETPLAPAAKPELFPRGEILLACALALAIRLMVLAGASKSPLLLHPQFDSRVFDAAAWDLVQGAPGSQAAAPLYTWFLATIYAMFGHDLFVPRLLQSLMDVGSIALLSATAYSVWGRGAAAFTANVAALYGPLIYFQSELSPATLCFFLVAASLFFTARAARSGSTRGVLLAGLALAFVTALAVHAGSPGATTGSAADAGFRVTQSHDRFLENLALAWNRREVPCDRDQDFFAAFNSPLFRLPWLLSFAFVGPIVLVAAWIERRRAPLLAGFLVVTTVVIAAVHVCDRTRLLLLAAGLPFMGFAVDRFLGTLAATEKRRAWRKHVPSVIGLACAAALVTTPFPGLQKVQSGAGWFAVADAYEAAGDMRGARKAYASAEENGMKSAVFYSRWGSLEQREGSGVQAEQHLLQATNLDLGYAPAHEKLGDVYFERGTFDQAGRQYAIAAGLVPARAAELYTRSGTAFEEQGDRGRAAEMFEHALRARPGYDAAEAGLERLLAPARAPDQVKMFAPLNPSSGR